MSGRIEFEFSPNANRNRREGEDPFRILVLADLSGRAFRERPRVPGLIPIDFDRFDAALSKCCAELPIGGGEFTPRELEGLDADTLFDALPIFSKLRDLKNRLQDPSTFAEAAAEMGRIETPPAEAADAAAEESFESILDREASRRNPARRQLDEYLSQIISRHVVPEPAADQAQWIATTDQALTEAMRSVLSDPLLSHVEQTWRPIHRLISELELGEEIELELVDTTLADLEADFSQAGAIEETALFREIIEPRPNRWAVCMADFEFGLKPEHLTVLPTLGQLAVRAGGPLIAGASPQLVGANSFFDDSPHDWCDPVEASGSEGLPSIWKALRQSELAPWIALAGPRILQRLPYGQSWEPVDAFPFEELESGGDSKGVGSKCLVWGNAAYAAVEMLGLAFQQRGWGLSPGDVRQVQAPYFTTLDTDGEIIASSSAQVFLTEAAAKFLDAQGIMAIVDDRSSDQVFLHRFISIAQPARAIAGSWQGD